MIRNVQSVKTRDRTLVSMGPRKEDARDLSTILVTDVQERAALAALRGLAQAGYCVAGAATSRPAQGHWSRYCDQRIMLPDPRANTAAYADCLEQLFEESKYTTVLPGTDASLRAISEHRDRLGELAQLGLPPKDVVTRSLDKIHLLDAAAQSGLAAPPSILCPDEAEARKAIHQLGIPVIVKPNSSCLVFGQHLRSQVSLFVDKEEGIEGVVDKVGSPFIMQRYEPSAHILSCAGVMGDGRLLAFAASSYVRTWPPRNGSVSYSSTVTASHSLVGKVETLMTSMDWQGIFELELLHLEDDRFAAIDLNPRVYGSLALAIRAGANLPSVWCDWLRGYGTSFVVARPGIYYRWEDGEFLNLMHRLSRLRLRSAASCLRPQRDTVHAALTRRDPLPLLARILWVTWRLVRRVVRRSLQPFRSA